MRAVGEGARALPTTKRAAAATNAATRTTYENRRREHRLKILHAARLASQWHASQRRKGANREPYVNHLLEVAELVSATSTS